MYNAIYTHLKNVRPHPNADKVLLATAAGYQVVVGLETKEGDPGIYFPTDGQIAASFLRANNLFREKTFNKDGASTGYFEDHRRVRTQKFRGEISDGFWIPTAALAAWGTPAWIINSFKEGDEFNTLDGKELCNKYVIQVQHVHSSSTKGKKGRKEEKLKFTSDMFLRHYDTPHLVKLTDMIPEADEVLVTEKLHGTSGRSGHIKFKQPNKYPKWLINILGWADLQIKDIWGYVSGSRNVDYFPGKDTSNAFHDPGLREKAHALFLNKLRKGETVYYEIVGFEPSGAAIMGAGPYEKLGKEFVKLYGKVADWSYGTEKPNFDVYVYRMTMTNEDGQNVEYSWDLIQKRCTEIGVKVVPLLYKGPFGAIKGNLEELAKGPSVVDSKHIKEGYCLRWNDSVFKYKSIEFKILEGLIKDTGVPDLEENS